VADKQVVIPARKFAQSDQVARIKLQVGVQMKGLDVMDLQALAPMTTGYAGRLVRKMLMRHTRPLRTALMPMFARGFLAVIPSLGQRTPAIACPA
jgi:hypothetical protein